MSTKRLTRSRDDKWLAGLCGGFAEYTGLDATLIRVILIVATLLGAGSLIVIYLICWLLIPAATEYGVAATSLAPEPPSSSSH
jgi:phage shock protein PspC (stress-responsive transcriptional regulator)